MAHIRRLRGEIASIFTNRTRNSYKCGNKDCPSNKEPDNIGISSTSVVSGISGTSCKEEKISTVLVAAKKSLTRRKSCPAGPSHANIVTSRQTWTKVGNILFWCSTILTHIYRVRYLATTPTTQQHISLDTTFPPSHHHTDSCAGDTVTCQGGGRRSLGRGGLGRPSSTLSLLMMIMRSIMKWQDIYGDTTWRGGGKLRVSDILG